MNRTQRWTLAIIAVIAIGIALFAGGIALGQTSGNVIGFGPSNMMTGFIPAQGNAAQQPYGYMMGFNQAYSSTLPYGSSMMGNYGMMGMMRGVASGKLNGVKPLTIEQAKTAIGQYLTALNNPDLYLAEVMVFDNQAYGRVIEKSTGIGAFELLVDPVTLSVFPEYGPNMMWNLKYGIMGQGMMSGFTAPNTTSQMPVSADQARQIAQRYLDTYQPGAQADQKPDPFYGYYTIDVLREDKPVGMLSVNGYSGQVFVHTWHGNFIEMSED